MAMAAVQQALGRDRTKHVQHGQACGPANRMLGQMLRKAGVQRSSSHDQARSLQLGVTEL